MATGTIQHHLALLGPATSKFTCTLIDPVYRTNAFTTFIGGGQEGTLYCRSSKDKCTLLSPCQTVPSTTNPLDVSPQNVMLALPVKEILCLKAIQPALLRHRSKPGTCPKLLRRASTRTRCRAPPRPLPQCFQHLIVPPALVAD